MKSLFDSATRTGQPVPTSSSRRRVSSSECQVFLPKSCGGSMRMPSRRTPSSAARDARPVTVSSTSATTSAYPTRCGRVRGASPPACEQTRPAPVSAATSASRGSAPPQVSLIRSAPAATASRATSARQVSIEMSTSRKRARTAATVETVRRISSATSTPRPGPAFTPPMSIRSAPAATAASTALSAASSAYVVPRSKNESGVRFDTVLRGYRMAQVDLALRRAAYDIGYKQELIGVLEAEVEALREGRTDEADKLREARMAALSAIAGHPGDADGRPADADGRPGDADAIGEAGATDVIASADEAEDEPSPRPEKTEGDGSWRRPEEMRLS